MFFIFPTLINNKILNRIIISTFLLTIILILFTSESNSENIKLNSLRDSVNKYYFTFDIKGLKRTLNNAENYLLEDPNNYYANYYNGIIRYCLGRVLYNTDSDVSYDYFDSALEKFENAYSIEKNPVALAMISASYGKLSALSPLRAIFWGQKAKNRIYDAYNLDSNNSKILLVAATHLMHVPGIYGGDKKKARRMLDKCLEINKSKVNQNEYELNWANNAEINAYIAQLDILEEKIDSARLNMKKALQLQPRYGFVIIDLENQISQLTK